MSARLRPGVVFRPDDITVIRNDDTGQVVGYRLDRIAEPFAITMAAAAALGAALARFESAIDLLRESERQGGTTP